MTKTKIIIGVIIVIIVIGGIWYGVSRKPKEEVIKIGFIGPLTGDFSEIGEAIQASVSLAADEINKNGGIDDKKVKIIYEDGGCEASKAFNAGNKLINIDKVDYLLTGCSPGTLAIAPLAEKNKVVTLAYVSSSPDITNAGDYIFRIYKNDNDAGLALAQYMYNRDYKNVAVLWSLNDYSKGISAVFKSEFERQGGEINFEESFETSLKDYRTIITKMKTKYIDAIVLFDFSDGIINYFEQAEELGFNKQVYGVDNFDDPKLIEVLGGLFEGSRYVEVKQLASQEFKEKIKQKTGKASLPVGVTNAYDAIYILKNAIEKVGDNSEKVKDYLYRMPAYKGESGTVKFNADGDLESLEFELREIKDGNAVVID